jgi:LPXTG-site transpeptidase (sortase) family protein
MFPMESRVSPSIEEKHGFFWPVLRRFSWGRLLSSVLVVCGVLVLLGAAAYAAYSFLHTWLLSQNRFLRSHDVVALSVPDMTYTPSATPMPTPLPTFTPTPTPVPPPTPLPTPLPPPAPIQIRIPALGVSRSIVTLPRIRDSQTGAWTWNANSLFRRGSTDLVGHWVGSAYPGQEGNMILAGHNYGYGYNGVFVRLGSIRTGQKVYVVNSVGQTFTYTVTQVKRVKWRSKDLGELTQHLSFLALGGPERVTLVSCAGADIEPFPERVYVVAMRDG